MSGGWWARLLERLRGPKGPAKDELGRRGERAAERHLVSLGYRVLGRNVRVAMGEADLVCESPEGVAVIVEVKTRRGRGGTGAAMVGERAVQGAKLRRLRAIAEHLRRANGWQGRAVRIDVVGVTIDEAGGVEVRHYAGAG